MKWKEEHYLNANTILMLVLCQDTDFLNGNSQDREITEILTDFKDKKTVKG